MEKIEGIEACLIPAILETEEDAREVVYEVVRIGREVNRRNVINELVYRELDVLKDAESLPNYRTNKILIEDKEVRTLDLFVKEYGIEKFKSFLDINRILIQYAFGEGCVEVFNYAQRKINLTKRQRIGGEKLKDAHAFVHSARAAGILYGFGATPYQIKLSFLHDVIEELRDWRIDQREKADEEEKTQLQKEIENPPEYGEIRSLLVELCDETEARLTIYHLRLLTRWLNKNYEQYVSRMMDGCGSDYALGLIRSITSDPEEQMNLYFTPPIDKVPDSMDNTIRLPEGDMPKKRDRLENNLELLGGIYEFLNSERIEEALGTYLPPPKILTDLCNGLITVSLGQIAKIEQLFKGDSYLGIRADLEEFRGFKDEFEKFREMYSKYEPASELVAS